MAFKILCLVHVEVDVDQVQKELEEGHDGVKVCNRSQKGVSWLVEIHIEVDVSVDRYLDDPDRVGESVDVPVLVSEVPHRKELEDSQPNSDVGKMLVS